MRTLQQIQLNTRYEEVRKVTGLVTQRQPHFKTLLLLRLARLDFC